MPPPIPGLESLEISRQLLSVLNEMSNVLTKQNESYKQQAELLRSISENRNSNNLGNSSSQIEQLLANLKNAKEGSDHLGDSVKSTAESLKKLSVPAEFLNGFKAGLSLSNNLFMSIIRMGGTALGTIKNIGGAILSMPGKIMNFFQNAAGGGTDEYRAALEEVRDAFGNLAVGTSKSVVNMTKDLKNFNSIGVSFGHVFGHGRAGMANLLKENAELAKGMGFMFNRMAESLKGNVLGLTVLRKATGMSAEAFKSMTLAAEGSGRSVGSMVTEMNIKLAQAEKTFGISTKEIGRDVDAMLKDTATFGRMAPDAMIKTSVYVKKLGISIETLKKVMDKSLNFEDAAQQAASLSEAFNMNIDAMKLMKEQDPSKKLDMIRESFFRTGKSVESLSIAEMKALSNATNLSDEELRLSFSLKNRGMNQAQIAEQMKKGQKNQMTEAEAMQTLAKSIKQLVQSGSGLKGSFFDVFMDGFDRGIRRSHEFRRVVRNLQHSMRDVKRAGIEVGHAFVDLFPGIQDILGGLGDLFDPARYRRLMDGVIATFTVFFHNLQTQPEKAFEEFAKSMGIHFLGFFDDGSPGSTRFLTGLQKFFKTVGILMVQGVKFALNLLVKFIRGIAGFIANPSELESSATKVGTGFTGMFKKAVTYVVKEIGPIFVEIIKAITEVVKNLNTKLREILNPATGGFKGWIKKTFGGGGQNKSEIFEALKELWVNLKPALVELFKQLKELGKTLLPGALRFIFAYISPALFSGLFRGVLTIALRAALSSLGSIFTALSEFIGPISGATGAIVALVVALGALTYGFMTNSKKTAEIGSKIADFVANIGRYIGLGIGYVIKGLAIAIGLIVKFFADAQFRSKVIGALSSALMTVGNWVLQFLGGIIVGILEALGFENLAKAFKEQLKFLSDEVKDFTANWQNNFKLIGEFLKDFYKDNIKGFVDNVANAYGLVVDSIKTAFKFVMDIVKDIFAWVGKGFSIISEILSAPFRAIGSFFTGLSSLIDMLPDWLKPSWLKSLGGTLGSVGSGFTSFGNIIKGVFGGISDLFTGASKGFGGFIDVVKQDFVKVGTWFIEHNPFEFIGHAMESVASVADRIFGHSINTVVARDLDKVRAPAERMKQNISTSLETGFRNAANSSREHTQAIVNNVREANAQVQQAAQVQQTSQTATTLTPSTTIIDNLRSFINSIGSIGNIAGIGEKITNLQNVIKQIDDNFKGPNGVGSKITSLANTVKEISIPEGVGDKIKKIEEVFEVVKNLSEIVNTLRIPSGDNQTRQLNVLTEIFNPLMDLLGYLFTDPVNSAKLTNVIAAIAGRNFRGLSVAAERIKSISTLFDILKTSTESIRTLRGMGSNKDARIQSNFLDVPIDNINTAITAINQDTISGKPNLLKNPQIFDSLDLILRNISNRAPQLTSIKDKVVEMISAINSIASTTPVETASSKIESNLRTLIESLGKLEDGLDTQGRGTINSRIINIRDALKGRITSEVRGMITAYNHLSSELIADIPALDITLERAGESLTSNRALRIERGAFNMTVQVNIKLDAGDVTQALYRFNSNDNNSTKSGNFSPTAFNPPERATT